MNKNKFYIASSLKNKDQVRYVSNKLKDKGFIHTYDWTLNENVSDIETLRKIGQQEKNAVLASDFVIILLPGGKGTHIELGIALGQSKKIFLFSPDGAIDNLEETSTFYHLTDVEKCYGTLDDLLNRITV